MPRLLLATMVTLLTLLTTGRADEREVTLSVDNMHCAACPYIVQQSLEAMPGVTKVEVSYEHKTAIVTFDDAKTDVRALVKATTDAGYPSMPWF